MTVIRGALDLTAKKARQAMTPLDKVCLRSLSRLSVKPQQAPSSMHVPSQASGLSLLPCRHDHRASAKGAKAVGMCLKGQPHALQVFMLAADTVLDGESLARVLRMGHSRVPVHRPGDRTDLLGVVLVKELVLLDPDDRVPFCPLGHTSGLP